MRTPRNITGAFLAAALVCAAIVSLASGGKSAADPAIAKAQAAPAGTTRTFYIAADEVAWNYAPTGRNAITGQPFGDTENVFVAQGTHRIGSTYKKALYREYTSATFKTLKPVPDQWAHTGLLGPVIRASVGDTIKVVFKNHGSRPYSVHPHGVFYAKDSEGAPYDDGTSGAGKADDAVAPGRTVTYIWRIPERAGPGPHDGNSIMWMYHSHVNEAADTNSGLMGPMIITAAGQAKADGTPLGVDREVVGVFSVMDENASWYLDDNIAAYAGDPGGTNPEEEGFEESNLMHSINGFVYGNGQFPQLKVGEHVRWYLMGMGTEVDLHTPHWHGNVVTVMGMRTDVVSLLPATMMTADMVVDDPGTWLFHCHVNDHIEAGMSTRYNALP